MNLHKAKGAAPGNFLALRTMGKQKKEQIGANVQPIYPFRPPTKKYCRLSQWCTATTSEGLKESLKKRIDYQLKMVGRQLRPIHRCTHKTDEKTGRSWYKTAKSINIKPFLLDVRQAILAHKFESMPRPVVSLFGLSKRGSRNVLRGDLHVRCSWID